jgi:hypothetical protein
MGSKGMSYVGVGNLIASLICDRVAIDMILKQEGVSENVRENVREMFAGRIEDIRENKLIIDDILEDAPPSRKDFKAGYTECYRDLRLQDAKFYNRPIKNRDVYEPFEGDVDKAWGNYLALSETP